MEPWENCISRVPTLWSRRFLLTADRSDRESSQGYTALTHDRKCRSGLPVDVGNSEQPAVTAARNKYGGCFCFVFFLSESSWHSLKNGRDKEKGPRTHTHRHDNVPLMNVEYDKEAPYRFALDRDTPINLTRHRQTNGSPYCLVTHRNEFRNEWIKYRCYLYHDTAKLPIVVIFSFFFLFRFSSVYLLSLFFIFFK